MNSVEERLQYFVDYWKDRNTGITARKSFIKLYSPRALINEFSDEVKFKKLSNKDNKKFFFDQIKIPAQERFRGT
jgi:hypothetical protein